MRILIFLLGLILIMSCGISPAPPLVVLRSIPSQDETFFMFSELIPVELRQERVQYDMPLSELYESCQGRYLYIYEPPNGEIISETEVGFRTQIYGHDSESQELVLLFDGLLAGFHGRIDSDDPNCQGLLVSVERETSEGSENEIVFALLKYNFQTDRYELSSENVPPSSIQWGPY